MTQLRLPWHMCVREREQCQPTHTPYVKDLWAHTIAVGRGSGAMRALLSWATIIRG